MNMPTLEKVCCDLRALEASLAEGGDLDVAALQEEVDTLQAPNTESIAGAGTAYALTDTAAAVDLGTTDPVIVLGVAGTYLIIGTIQLDYAGATVVAETATVKLRRTNNTPADIGTPVVLDLPVATTLTNTYKVVPIVAIVTTANINDSITLFANVSVALGAGAINASAATIHAIKLG